MKKCYDKELEYIVPTLRCSFCHEKINPGDELHSVILTWDDGRTACKKCADQYEIDWEMHKTEEGEFDEF